MEMEYRKSAFIQLGRTLGHLAAGKDWPGFECGLTKEEFEQFQQVIATHYQSNGWFTEENVRKSLAAWSNALEEKKVTAWLGRYDLSSIKPRNVAIICAGNIPMVGWHDVMSVLVSGHRALIKLSTDDAILIPLVLKVLVNLQPEFATQFEIVTGRLEGHEAVIATGSNNTSRYFNYYFKDIPHIIRKSRTSMAVLDGSETEEELKGLARDIFDYFGMGCRNVSHIHVPAAYDLDIFFGALYPHRDIVNHNKYANNYDYNKAIWLLNQEDMLENGFMLLKEDKKLAAPTGSIFYTRYKDRAEVEEYIASHIDAIQCVVGKGHIAFGAAQSPELWDYADGVDTLEFLSTLH